MKKKKRIAIFDCDLLIYRVSAACENRSIVALHKKSGKSKVFKNRTEMENFLKEKGFTYVDNDFTVTDIQEVNEDINYRYILDNQIKTVTERLWQDETLFFVAGKGNFRDSLSLPKKYKGQREKTLAPLLRDSCKSYLKQKYKAKPVDEHEVDDEIIIQGYEYLKKGYDVVLITSDKDSHAYGGLSLYNFTTDNPEIVKIPDLGSLWLDDKNKVRGLGFLFYALQMGIGDLTDSYRPTELAGVKFGEKSMYSLLKDCTSEQEALQIVISLYRKWYPKPITYEDCFGVTQHSTWKNLISLYHKCVRMKATPDDPLVFNDFAKKYGVDLDNYNDEGEP
jgi:hypothetical protein